MAATKDVNQVITEYKPYRVKAYRKRVVLPHFLHIEMLVLA